MNFLNPFALIGLAAASIPVILHLLNLRKLKQVEFSSLKFLKELQKNKIRRLKIRQIILLILRTALIIFAVLSFARPSVEAELPFAGSYSKTSAIILVDNSLSMDVSDESGNRFSQAKKCVADILKGLRDGDEIALIPLADPPSPELLQFSRNADYVNERLASLAVSNATANIPRGLRLAEKLIASSENLNKEIYIVGDARRNTLANTTGDSTAAFAPGVNVFFAGIGLESSYEAVNLGVDSVAVISRIFRKDNPVEVEVRVRNYSDKNATGVTAAMYFNETRVAQRLFDIPAGETKTISISAPPGAAGAIGAYVEIDPDGMDADNKKYFGFIVPDRPRVLLAGGMDESLYLSLVLGAAAQGADNPVETEKISPAELSGKNLEDFDVLILAGGPYGKSDFEKLSKYVADGGSAFIFADFKSDRQVFASAMRNLGFGSVGEKEYPDDSPVEFGEIDRSHPLFEGVFAGEESAAISGESPKIKKAAPVDGGRFIINMSGGAFLSESVFGEGRALYCAVPPDDKHGNFPFTAIFPAMNFRAAFYLSSPADFASSVYAGESLNLVLPKKFAAGGVFETIDPNGIPTSASAAVFPGGAALSFYSLQTLGAYKVSNSAGKPVAVFAVNVDPSESDPNRPTGDELEKVVRSYFSGEPRIEFIKPGANLSAGVERARTGTELWQPLLLLAVFCAVAEMFVARIGKKDAE